MMFKRVHLEISNICNVQCSFCPVVERPNEVMSLKNFSKILTQVVPITDDVCLHLMGEPLAHPEFEKFITEGEQQKASFQITTNGLLIKRYESLILEGHAIRQINFSLQAFKDNFPERELSEYLDPIITFTKKAFEKRPELYINFRLWNLADNAENENEEVFLFLERAFSVSINRNVDPGFNKSKKLIPGKRLYLHFDSRFDWPSLNFPTVSEKGRCHGLGNHFGIHADGRVVPCCLDKEAVIELGNAFDDSIENILNSSRSVALKKGFEDGVLVEEMCQKCTYRKRFK